MNWKQSKQKRKNVKEMNHLTPAATRRPCITTQTAFSFYPPLPPTITEPWLVSVFLFIFLFPSHWLKIYMWIDLKLEKWDHAIEDCNFVLNYEASNIKALLRRSTAYLKKKNFTSAKIDIDKCVQLEANNKKALVRVE